jgi:hypothetical protein
LRIADHWRKISCRRELVGTQSAKDGLSRAEIQAIEGSQRVGVIVAIRAGSENRPVPMVLKPERTRWVSCRRKRRRMAADSVRLRIALPVRHVVAKIISQLYRLNISRQATLFLIILCMKWCSFCDIQLGAEVSCAEVSQWKLICLPRSVLSETAGRESQSTPRQDVPTRVYSRYSAKSGRMHRGGCSSERLGFRSTVAHDRA